MAAIRKLLADIRAGVANLPLPLRMSVSTALVAGVLGGITGLVLGLNAYPPTAWFAVFEVGIPAAFVGGICGLVIGGVLWMARKDRPTV